jgi:hypothetical protein
MLPPQDAGPAIRDLKQTRPTVTRAKPGLGDAIHAVTLSERRGPRRTRADPPFGAADWRVRVAPVWAQIPVICARPQSRLPDAQSSRSMAGAGSACAAWSGGTHAARSSSPWRKTRRGTRDAREPANILVNRTTLRHPCHALDLDSRQAATTRKRLLRSRARRRGDPRPRGP